MRVRRAAEPHPPLLLDARGAHRAPLLDQMEARASRSSLWLREAPRLDSSISPAVQVRLEDLCARLAKELPAAPHRVASLATHVDSHSAWDERVLWKDEYGDKAYSYTMFGLPESAAVDVRARLTAMIAAEGLPIRVVWGGVVAMVAAGVSKGHALHDFARRFDFKVSGIIKLGDNAAEHGNDVELLVGANAYNVGPKPAKDPDVVNCETKHSAGVGLILRGFLERGEIPAAIASDLDGTLVDFSGDSAFAHETLIALKELLERGTRLAIITGRGSEGPELVLGPLRRAGASAEALARVSFYLFHGALRV